MAVPVFSGAGTILICASRERPRNLASSAAAKRAVGVDLGGRTIWVFLSRIRDELLVMLIRRGVLDRSQRYRGHSTMLRKADRREGTESFSTWFIFLKITLFDEKFQSSKNIHFKIVFCK
jgi:hypothetical protein